MYLNDRNECDKDNDACMRALECHLSKEVKIPTCRTPSICIVRHSGGEVYDLGCTVYFEQSVVCLGLSLLRISCLQVQVSMKTRFLDPKNCRKSEVLTMRDQLARWCFPGAYL